MLAATAELVAERGYRNTAITRICKAAGVGRNTFYEHFESKEDCFLATFDDGVDQARRRIADAVDPEAEWSEQLRAGLRELLRLIASELALARTCLVESLAAGPAAIEHYESVLASLIPFFARGREAGSRSGKVPEAMEETIIRGLAANLNQRLMMDEGDELEALLSDLLEFSLAPYLGDEAARTAAEQTRASAAS